MFKNQEERMKDFIKYAGGIFSTKQVTILQEQGYFLQPASLNFHGQQAGDLYLHSKIVAQLLEEFTEKLSLTWSRQESPRIIGLLHDLCKADDYKLITNQTNNMYEDHVYREISKSIHTTEQFEKNSDKLLNGHGDKSVILALQLNLLTDEEVMCIRYHMGAYEGEKVWKSLENAIKKYPNILWTIQADMIASQILDV